MSHIKCINSVYPKSEVQRYTIPAGKVQWDEDYSEYDPIFYESPALIGKLWADKPIGTVVSLKNTQPMVLM